MIREGLAGGREAFGATPTWEQRKDWQSADGRKEEDVERAG